MKTILQRMVTRQTQHGTRVATTCRTCRPYLRQSSTESTSRWSTPLAKQLAEAITTTGPIPVASFMRQCLTSDLGGYYSSESSNGKDQFGVKGDFVTSPEISQIFGELVGLWVVAEWIAQGRRREGIQLLEIGPGRGTLMDDMLRTIRNFPDLAKGIDEVYLIEASPALRKSQHQRLCGDNPLKADENGHSSIARHSENLKIKWAEDIRLITKDPSKTPFVVAHEFFDALPIHIFQSIKPPIEPDQGAIQTPTGPIQTKARRLPQENHWREMLVSPAPLSRLKDGEADFELILSKTATPHSMYLPETSTRYKALKNTDGAIIEISPESQAYARDFAIRIGGPNPVPTSVRTSSPSGSKISKVSEQDAPKPEPSGAALIVDYGQASLIPLNSLRGIRAHQLVSPFSKAGTTDVSADVDFLALAEAAIDASPGVEVHGPVDQGRFLTAMGIQERAAQLVKKAMESGRGTGDGTNNKEDLTEIVKRIEGGWKRLVDQSPQGMGRLYQVMAIVPHRPVEEGSIRRRPVGFGGDVQL